MTFLGSSSAVLPALADLDEEWLTVLHRAAGGGRGYPVFQSDAPGHVVIVATPGHVQARCTCGWHGPDRTGDPHAVGLVLDDTAWHCHEVGGDCPQAPGCVACIDRQETTP